MGTLGTIFAPSLLLVLIVAPLYFFLGELLACAVNQYLFSQNVLNVFKSNAFFKFILQPKK
jgi:hypothetical protein